MKDFKHIDDEKVRELSLMTKATHPNQAFNEYDAMLEEAHYYQTVNAFVELIVLYGWDKVIGDLRTAMGEKQW
jgi:hypothetical protein